MDHRRMINGMLWIARTGAPWRDLPERYGAVGTVSSRFYRWRKAGIWDQIWALLQHQAAVAGHLDWAMHSGDGSILRAHQHAAGAKRGTQRPKRSAGAKVGSAPKFTFGLRGAANQ
jgi:transposase